MTIRGWVTCALCAVMVARCTGSATTDVIDEDATADDAPSVDVAPLPDVHWAREDVPPPPDTGPCSDADADGISDLIEGRYVVPPTDTDGDGLPDYLDTDADNDGVNDIDEGVRNYPGYASEALAVLSCGEQPNNCSPVSGSGDWRNLDSDADGLSDHDEAFVWHTDPCNPTTHTDPTTGEPINDLLWADSGGMAPPPRALYVILPRADPACPIWHTHRQFDVATAFQSADVFFVVDSSASMAGTLTALSDKFTAEIVPGLTTAAPDLRIGVGDYRSFPESPDGAPGSDYILHVGRSLTRDYPSVQGAINRLQTGGGGDTPNPATEAVFQSFVGSGLDPAIPGHDDDLTIAHGCALGPLGTTCTAPDSGWASAMNPVRDCMDDPSHLVSMGWGCFQAGRVPIVVLISDADWVHDLHDDCDVGVACSAPPFASTMYGRGGHTFAQLGSALASRGAYFVGIDVGSGGTHANAMQLARDTGTVDGAGAPIAPIASSDAVANTVVDAVTTVVANMRQDITSRVDAVADPDIAAGHTSADFIRAVTPVRANPAAPVGYDTADATTFYGVRAGATVTFDVDFFNDFQSPGLTLAIFRANVTLLGRAGTVVDRVPVFIVTGSTGCSI